MISIVTSAVQEANYILHQGSSLLIVHEHRHQRRQAVREVRKRSERFELRLLVLND